MTFRINASGHKIDGLQVTVSDFWAALKAAVTINRVTTPL